MWERYLAITVEIRPSHTFCPWSFSEIAIYFESNPFQFLIRNYNRETSSEETDLLARVYQAQSKNLQQSRC